MTRFLFWLVLLVVAVVAIRNKLGRQSRADDPNMVPRDGGQIEAMLACAHCGVHFPASEAVRDRDRIFCCEQHRQMHTP